MADGSILQQVRNYSRHHLPVMDGLGCTCVIVAAVWCTSVLQWGADVSGVCMCEKGEGKEHD